MGIEQQAGDIVKSVTSGFAGAPGCLAIVLIVGVLAYMNNAARERESIRANERFMALMSQCFAAPSGKGEFHEGSR
jgi:hypothetical protein